MEQQLEGQLDIFTMDMSWIKTPPLKTTSIIPITEVELQELFELAKRQVEEAGIIIGKLSYSKVKINPKLTRRWGQCFHNYYTKTHRIEVSAILLTASKKNIMDTLIHELLHTCDGCDNHGPLWKRYVAIMNSKYGYNIKRTTSSEEKGLDFNENIYKYVLKCKTCGKKTLRNST